MSEIQSVVFVDTKKWNIPKSRKWLIDNGFKTTYRNKKVDILKNKDGVILQYRYRQKTPNMFESFMTKKTDKGINFVIGFRKAL